ncbi:voltage-gated sodium channel [Notoacmeibacter marinus]|uniref:Voltage-gated sodium channel n=1 Tax=Notoacmeibacter marinus TaxID=1876515 RepID=A0A231UXN3_9HYPH|nr:ion transporter [Notoacmeibacter marinus]OXT00698.1 voltage-gated sodium channel [Notoacmeibacter marinus]
MDQKTTTADDDRSDENGNRSGWAFDRFPPHDRSFRARAARLISSKRFEWTVIVLVVLNAIILGLETSTTVMGAVGPVLKALDKTILAVFVVELALRAFVHRARFFHDGWRVFDLFVVGIALVPTSGDLAVLRALRVLRILRLISVIPSLRKVVTGLVTALPGMGSIVVLMALVFYVFSVMATGLFGETFPDWFGGLGASAYSLFQIMTLESWSMGIVRPVMEAHSWAWIFFIAFIMSTTFTVLNLFIGIIVSAMQAEHEGEAAEERHTLQDNQAAMAEEVKAMRAELQELTRLLRERDR